MFYRFVLFDCAFGTGCVLIRRFPLLPCERFSEFPDIESEFNEPFAQQTDIGFRRNHFQDRRREHWGRGNQGALSRFGIACEGVFEIVMEIDVGDVPRSDFAWKTNVTQELLPIQT